MKTLNIRSIIETKGSAAVFTMPETVSVAAFIREACRRNIGAMLVTGTDGRLAGIITERDILRLCDKKVDFDTSTLGDVMTRNLVTISLDDDIHVAVELMFKKKIRHLPVISGEKMEGIITVRDLLHAMCAAHEDELRSFVAYLQEAVDAVKE